MSRTLALDVGERRIGVALGDPTGVIAQPLRVIERRGWEKDLGDIRALAQEYQVRRIIVGYPVTLAGRQGSRGMNG